MLEFSKPNRIGLGDLLRYGACFPHAQEPQDRHTVLYQFVDELLGELCEWQCSDISMSDQGGFGGQWHPLPCCDASIALEQDGMFVHVVGLSLTD